MGKVYLDMAMSLDGFISGPNGEDMGLHDWYFSPSGDAEAVKAEILDNMGAMILGKQAFGNDLEGFDTPYKLPHFVITHQAQKTIERGGTQFIFVTDGLESALAQAQAVAGDKDVCVAGGASIAQQCLNAGLLDEIQVHLVPVLMGGGTRLFDGLERKGIQLERTRVLSSGGTTHLRFRVVREK